MGRCLDLQQPVASVCNASHSARNTPPRLKSISAKTSSMIRRVINMNRNVMKLV